METMVPAYSAGVLLTIAAVAVATLLFLIIKLSTCSSSSGRPPWRC